MNISLFKNVNIISVNVVDVVGGGDDETVWSVELVFVVTVSGCCWWWWC
jgi:hypothetical protein